MIARFLVIVGASAAASLLWLPDARPPLHGRAALSVAHSAAPPMVSRQAAWQATCRCGGSTGGTERRASSRLTRPSHVVAVGPTVAVRGAVTDRRGTPVAGARVDVLGRGARWVSADARGRFHIDLPAAATRTVGLCVAADGFVSRELRREVPAAGRVLDLAVELVEPAVLHGIVVDPTGKPVSGADVVCRGQETVVQTMRTDAKGRFHFDGVASGEAHEIHVAHPVPGRSAPVRHRANPADSPVMIELACWLPGKARLAAELVDQGGDSLAVCAVRLQRADIHTAPRRVRAVRGSITANGLEAGRWLLSVWPDQGPPIQHGFSVGLKENDVRLRVVQAVGVSVAGRILLRADPDRPMPERLQLTVEGDTVGRWQMAGGRVLDWATRGLTVDLRADRSFRLVDVAPDRPFTIAATGAGWGGRGIVRCGPGTETALTLIVEPTAEVIAAAANSPNSPSSRRTER